MKKQITRKKPRRIKEADVDETIQQAIDEFEKKFPGLLEELFEEERKENKRRRSMF